MGLFSKEECNLCGEKAGFLSRKRLVNKSGYICKECEKKCSFLIDVSQFTPEGIKEHISYMEKQNKIYKEAYEVLDKKKKERYIHSFRGIIFADDIAMFEVVDPKGDKKIYKELFRYDQIENYNTYNVANNDSQNGKKYSEVGVIINLKSSLQDVFGSNNRQYAKAPDVHPYVNKLKITTGRDVNDLGSTREIIDKFDKLFNRYEDRSVLGSVKASFVGTESQKRQREYAKNAIGAAGSMLKAKITKNDEDIEKATTEKINGMTGTVKQINGEDVVVKYVSKDSKYIGMTRCYNTDGMRTDGLNTEFSATIYVLDESIDDIDVLLEEEEVKTIFDSIKIEKK